MRKNTKGFTLAELLIVVAIIAVLVAVSIPIFTGQLKKARLAVDHSAIRDAYALAQIANNLQEVEIEGNTYSFEELKTLRGGDKVHLVLSEDCGHFNFDNNLIGSFTAPTGAYSLKESGCTEENEYQCETCSPIGFGVYHYKGCGIFLTYNPLINQIYMQGL